MFRCYIKRIFLSPIFLGCVILLAGMMLFGVHSDLKLRWSGASDTSLMYFLWLMGYSFAMMLIHTLASVPFLFFFVEELESKAIYYQVIRSKRKMRDYYIIQGVSALLSSASVIVIALLLFTVCCWACGAGWKTCDSMEHLFRGTYFAEQIQKSEAPVYFLHILSIIMYASPWVLFGLLASLISKNRYLIFAAPYLLFMFSIYIMQFFNIYQFSPVLTILHENRERMSDFGGGIFYNLIYNTLFFSILLIAYCTISERRFRHEGI